MSERTDAVDPINEAVADARYLMRRAFRIIDEEARKRGLDALAHQLLVQLRGAPQLTRSVSELAVRLDVPLNLVSRLARTLEVDGHVTRTPDVEDRRVTLICATTAGVDLAQAIGEKALVRFTELHDALELDRRRAALMLWARNFGVVVVPQVPKNRR